MDKLPLYQALTEFREDRLHLSQGELAKKLGIGRSTYANYESEAKQTTPPEKILRQLRLMGFDGDVSGPISAALQIHIPIPYIGGVAASQKADWTDPFESEDIEYVPPEMGDKKGRFCCRVLSDSMYDLLTPGDLIVFQADPTPKIGKVCLYRSPDNHITIKQLRHNGRDYILHPLNEKYDDEVADGVSLGYLVGIVRDNGTRRLTVYDVHGINP